MNLASYCPGRGKAYKVFLTAVETSPNLTSSSSSIGSQAVRAIRQLSKHNGLAEVCLDCFVIFCNDHHHCFYLTQVELVCCPKVSHFRGLGQGWFSKCCNVVFEKLSLQNLLKAGLLTEREKKKLEKLSCAEEENRQVLQPQPQHHHHHH